jgi:hypothetical protein
VAVSPSPACGLSPPSVGVLPLVDVDGVGLGLCDGDVGGVGDGELLWLGDPPGVVDDGLGRIVGVFVVQPGWFGAPEVWCEPRGDDRDPELAWDWPGPVLLPPVLLPPLAVSPGGPVAACGETT